MTATSTDQVAVSLSRTIAAPPERVYRAWLDPEVLRQWMSGGAKTVTRAEVDEQPGGHFRIWQVDADGEDSGGFESEIVELVPNERIVFNWGFVGPQRAGADSALDSRLTITLREVAEGTELALLHERLDAFRAAMPEVAGKISGGWEQALAKLDRALAA